MSARLLFNFLWPWPISFILFSDVLHSVVGRSPQIVIRIFSCLSSSSHSYRVKWQKPRATSWNNCVMLFHVPRLTSLSVALNLPAQKSCHTLVSFAWSRITSSCPSVDETAVIRPLMMFTIWNPEDSLQIALFVCFLHSCRHLDQLFVVALEIRRADLPVPSFSQLV